MNVPMDASQEIARLHALLQSGALTSEEFTVLKKAVIDSVLRASSPTPPPPNQSMSSDSPCDKSGNAEKDLRRDVTVETAAMAIKAYKCAITILNNILASPEELRYRVLRLANQTLARDLFYRVTPLACSAGGTSSVPHPSRALELLLSCGFIPAWSPSVDKPIREPALVLPFPGVALEELVGVFADATVPPRPTPCTIIEQKELLDAALRVSNQALSNLENLDGSAEVKKNRLSVAWFVWKSDFRKLLGFCGRRKEGDLVQDASDEENMKQGRGEHPLTFKYRVERAREKRRKLAALYAPPQLADYVSCLPPTVPTQNGHPAELEKYADSVVALLKLIESTADVGKLHERIISYAFDKDVAGDAHLSLVDAFHTTASVIQNNLINLLDSQTGNSDHSEGDSHGVTKLKFGNAAVRRFLLDSRGPLEVLIEFGGWVLVGEPEAGLHGSNDYAHPMWSSRLLESQLNNLLQTAQSVSTAATVCQPAMLVFPATIEDELKLLPKGGSSYDTAALERLHSDRCSLAHFCLIYLKHQLVPHVVTVRDRIKVDAQNEHRSSIEAAARARSERNKNKTLMERAEKGETCGKRVPLTEALNILMGKKKSDEDEKTVKEN